MPGPPPKRTEVRRRRNDNDKVERASNTVSKLGPDLPVAFGITDPLALAWYESLRTSGQAIYYTDSDWISAAVVATAIQKFSEKPAAGILTAILQGMGSLMATEGDRRRMRLELERNDAAEDPEELAAVADFAEYQRKLGG